jgi:hypothetical protein
MTRLLEQFLEGDVEGAWERARALGPAASSDAHAEEVLALATETADRVDRNVDRLIERLEGLQFRFASPSRIHRRPPEDAGARLRQLEAELGSLLGEPAPIPAILWALATHVGDVVLLGSCDRWDPPTYQFDDLPPDVTAIYADPLVFTVLGGLEGAVGSFEDPDYLEEQALDGVPPTVSFAPDRCHKANHSGGTQEIEWPAWSPDPVLRGANQWGHPPVTVVEYLRESFRWGGFPGFADHPDAAPMADIELLAADLEPI